MFSVRRAGLCALDDGAYEHVVDSQPAFLETVKGTLDAAGIKAAVVRYCPPLEEQNVDGFIAGGFLRDWVSRRIPRDLDLYIRRPEGASSLEDSLRRAGWTLDRMGLVSTSWRDSQQHVVQVIRTEIENPSDCIARFDLTICCAAMHLRSQATYCASSFTDDVRQRRLIIHNPAFPVDTLRRVSRFVSDGYTISADQLLALHGRILREFHSHGVNAFRPYELL